MILLWTAAVSARPVTVNARAQMASHSVQIKARSMTAPDDCPASEGNRLQAVDLGDLQNGKSRSVLCDALRRDHVALIALPAGREHSFDAMWSSLEAFFDKSHGDREACAGALREIESEHHGGQVRNFGYASAETEDGVTSFVDSRLRQTGKGLRLQPQGIDENAPGFGSTVEAAQQVLFEVGLAAMVATGESLGLDASQVADLLDFPGQLPVGSTCNNVHRFAYYRASAKAVAKGNQAGTPQVAFQPHTDGTWFTVIPCASVAGLEVFASTEQGWRSPEREAMRTEQVGGASRARMIAVLSGEYLHLISDGEYKAALHRVIRPTAAPPRISAPLLMRASVGSGFSGQARDGSLLGRVLAEREAPASEAWRLAKKAEAIAHAEEIAILQSDLEEAHLELETADAIYDEACLSYERASEALAMYNEEIRGKPMTKEVQEELAKREAETEMLEQTLMRASHASADAGEASNDAEGAIEQAEEMRQLQIAKDGFELRKQRSAREAP